MQLKSLLKYAIRFVFLQSIIFFTTIWYFDNFIFLSAEHKFSIYLNLVEDRERFYNFVPISWITIDALIFVLIFIFLIILYSTKFYTYVNELDFSYENRYLDDYFMLYLLWNSFIFTSLYVFRMTDLSRANLVIFSFIVPALLIFFRNSEIISILLGKSVSNENYISFNLDEASNYRNLRILAFRNDKLSLQIAEKDLTNEVIRNVDKLNKLTDVNLVVIRLLKLKKLEPELEEYLVNLNKKVLIISEKELKFNTNFIFRLLEVSSQKIYYFNNDIQYGAKYILKRIFDIIISTLLMIVFLPLFIASASIIFGRDSSPVVIKQKRIGLHGKMFGMYKFRTMYNNSHEQRDQLKSPSQENSPLFKLDADPRIIKGLSFLRKYSIDELPQLLNVIRGEMSLVGPRPLFAEDTEYFDKNYMRRLNVLPGMTGLLQINDRNTDDFRIWYKYDLEYIENWNLRLDVEILFKTLRAVFNRRNSGK
ncbi:sugar transferase [Acidimicrobiia bacterium]|nr:sugar transferase [Acidimicrobiia bacterium]